MTRMSRTSLPKTARIFAVDTPAAIEIISFFLIRTGAISRSTGVMIWGLTAMMPPSACRTSSPLFGASWMPYWRSSSLSRSRRTSLAQIASAGTTLAVTSPLMRASPMLPAPMKPIFLPLRLICRKGRRHRRAPRARRPPPRPPPGPIAPAKPALETRLGRTHDGSWRRACLRGGAGAAQAALAGQVQAVERMDEIEQLERVPHLVGLQVTHQVQGHGTGEDRDLLSRLLDAVLAERGQPGRHGAPDALDVDRLGDADQQHILRPAPRALGRPRDPLAHALEVRADVVHGRDSSIPVRAAPRGWPADRGCPSGTRRAPGDGRRCTGAGSRSARRPRRRAAGAPRSPSRDRASSGRCAQIAPSAPTAMDTPTRAARSPARRPRSSRGRLTAP